MIEQVEEIRAEAEILPFAEFERLAECQIDILLRRPDDAVARRVAVELAIAGGPVGNRPERVWLISSGVDPVCQARFRAAVAGSIGTTEPGIESRSRSEEHTSEL